MRARDARNVAWQTHHVMIGQAEADDLADLARLIWLNHFAEDPAQVSVYERLGFSSSRQLLQRPPD